ncbi:MAG: HNH endonuclease signature motif containing protein [Myxococcales bacterium]|nr:HNH endonuclease signature motif containing protein [Myxococcales bacterium]
MGDITYPRVDGVAFVHGAFQRGDSLFLPRKGAKKILEYRGWRFRKIRFRKRRRADREALRAAFEQGVRAEYLMMLAQKRRTSLLAGGLSATDIRQMEFGEVPPRYQVHHILPIDDGGDNAFENLVLIRASCEHSALTAYQNAFARGMQEGEEKEVDYPVPAVEQDFAIYPPMGGLPVELKLWPRRKQ